MYINLAKYSKTPYYWQITEQIRRQILTGDILKGSILPSERKLATQLGVHRNTIIRAYGNLKDAGLIDSKRGVGYIVSYELPSDKHLPKEKKRAVNWEGMIKEEYLAMKDTYDNIFQRFSEGSGISLSAGMPPFVYPEEEIGDTIEAILNESHLVPAYLAPYQGEVTLRRQIQSYVKLKGIQSEISEIQVLTETNQVLDFIVASLLEPGDYVIVEEPCSPDVYRLIEHAGATCLPIPMDLEGMIVDGIPDLVERYEPKFIYVNSSYHDPTGRILSLERRRKLLHYSNYYRIPIVEEDAGSELSYEDHPLPTLKSMDTTGNVVYIYSFALTYITGLSLAFVIADKNLIHSLRNLVSIRVVSINWLSQKLIARYLENGSYLSRCREIAMHNRRNRDIMCAMLDQYSEIGIEYFKPRGGVYIWVKLPEGLRSMDLFHEAAKIGVAIVPGEVFYPLQNGGQDHIRLNYSYESAEWLREGMERLLRLISKMNKEQKKKVLVP